MDCLRKQWAPKIQGMTSAQIGKQLETNPVCWEQSNDLEVAEQLGQRGGRNGIAKEKGQMKGEYELLG